MQVKRNTKQRAAVIEALKKYEGFVSAQQLYADLREEGYTLGLATVYRTLNVFVADHIADQLHSATGEMLFRLCDNRGHHHHLVCRGCGKTYEFESDVVEAVARDIAEKHGFTQVAHVIDLYGYCAECQGAVDE